jgi:hypothetical protein
MPSLPAGQEGLVVGGKGERANRYRLDVGDVESTTSCDRVFEGCDHRYALSPAAPL